MTKSYPYHDEAPHLPGKTTAQQAREVFGITFHTRNTGIMRYHIYSTDGRGVIGRNHNRSTYSASVDKASLGRRFRTERRAMEVVAAALKASKS